MILLSSTFGVSVASALFPLINIELYLAGVGAVGSGTAVSLGIVAGAGQSVGKIFWYEVAKRSVETDWVQRKLSRPKVHASYERWVNTMVGRPWYGGAVLFAAALAGIPPLLVMAAVAGALKMPYWVFLPTIFVGRALRFWLVLVGVEFLFGRLTFGRLRAMSLSQITVLLTRVAEESHEEPAVDPWFVGGGALAILLLMLLALVAFGGGREHS